MIPSFFIILWANIVSAAASLLPIQSLPADMSNAFQYIVNSLYKFSDIIPVTQTLNVVVAALSFELLVFGYKSTIWIYNKIRGTTGSK
jgi:hypothetical protein